MARVNRVNRVECVGLFRAVLIPGGAMLHRLLEYGHLFPER